MATTILVVEDEPAIAELVAVNLSFAGYKVLRAADTIQAETLIRAEQPDLILLDWMLPGSSGVQFAKKLRADDRTRDIPIIMLTARSEEGDKVEGLESGADDYMTKPFSPKELMARIKAVMRRRAPQLTEETVDICGLSLDPSTHRVSGGEQGLDLGPTEFRLLHFFMTHPERVHSRSQLLDQVWGRSCLRGGANRRCAHSTPSAIPLRLRPRPPRRDRPGQRLPVHCQALIGLSPPRGPMGQAK